MITGYTTKGEWGVYVGIHNGHTIVFDAKEVSVDRLDLCESWHSMAKRKGSLNKK